MSECLPPSRNVYLVGFMGSGKSTVGQLLAHHLGFNFVDLDRIIEERTGKSISETFALEGESRFRELESEALLQVASGRNAVIALGGGAFVSPDNRRVIEQTGISIWLKVSYEEAAHRCLGEAERPLARDPERFQELYRTRQPVYEMADIHIETDGLKPESVCALALQKFRSVC